ncbi:UNVERIFIED_CONTAM: hypothetical protein ITH36_24655, partial [Salmonella enterica subsp. enterica serovar Weltevreden]
MSFEAGDKVYLKVSPMKGVRRFGLKGKLSPRYVGPFYVIDRVGKVAYRLNLPANLSKVHNVFHVSTLKKCISDMGQVVEVDPSLLQPDLTYEEVPFRIVDRKQQEVGKELVNYIKVQWSNQSESEATWELKSEVQR